MTDVSQQPAVQRTAQRFGRYVLLELIGKGGMAEVFRAMSQGVEGFQRVFVVKRILREKSTSKDFVEMFINEARISALLNHPNIVQVYDFGHIEGSFFIAMEYLRGKDLLSVLRELRNRGKVMPPEVAAYIAQEVATGLHSAHSLTQHGGKTLNIVHRDVSPSNIMLLRAGGVKLLDFGIAKANTEVEKPGDTQAGTVKGKLSYLSPEQVRNEKIDGRSDVFSLGVVLWECLTGKRLFFDKTDYQTMKNVLERAVPPPSTQRFDLSPQIDYISVRALERALAQRYPSAKVMAEDLESYLGQSHFSPSALPKLLDELFGEDRVEVEDQLPDGPLTPVEASGQTTAAGGMAYEPTSYSVSPSVSPFSPADNFEGIKTEVPAAQPRPRSRATVWIVAAAATVAVAVGAGVVLKRQPPVSATRTAVSASASPGVVLAPPSLPAAGAAARAAAAGIGMVSIRLETDPRGAEVRGPRDTVLGITPTTAAFPRSQQGVSLVFIKAGYAPARHQIVPDRDVTALVTLRLVTRGRPGTPARPPSAAVEIAPSASSAAPEEPVSEIKIIPDPPAAAADDKAAEGAAIGVLPAGSEAAPQPTPADKSPSGAAPKVESSEGAGAAPAEKKSGETIDPFGN